MTWILACKRPSNQWFGFALILTASVVQLHGLDPQTPVSDYNIRRWRAEDGLIDNSVKRIIQSNEGYLWIATARGVSRFDGTTFKNFGRGQYPTLPSNNILSLAQTADGTLWIGTGEGLATYRDGMITDVSASAGVRPTPVNALATLPDGTLWIGQRNLIARWKDGTYLTPFKLEDMNLAGLRDIFVSGSSVWIAAGDRLVRYSDSHFILYGTSEGLPKTGIQSVRSDGRHIMVNTQAGLFVFDGNRFSPAEGISTVQVNTSEFDSDGNLWVGSASGLDRVGGAAVSRYLDSNGASIPNVNVLLEDRDKCLWLGTPSGLARLTNRRGRSLGRIDGVTGGLTLSVRESRDGSLWVSSWGAGVARFQGSDVTQFRLNAPLSHNSVTYIYEAPDGQMWFGNRGSTLDRWDGKTVRTYVYESGKVTSRFVSAMHTEPDGELIIGIAQRGVFTIRDDQIVPTPCPDRLQHTTIWWLGRVRDGRLLAATENGVFERLANREWTPVTLPGLESAISVRGLCQDEDTETVWLATEIHGLVRWAEGRILTFGTQQGLPDDFVSSVIDDHRGFLWITSARGISRLSKSQLDEVALGKSHRIAPVVFGRNDGLLSGSSPVGSGAPVSTRLRDGRLAFATDEGLALIDPAHVVVNTRPPAVVIESVTRNDQEVLIPSRNTLGVAPGTTRLEFKYTALSMIAPEYCRFKYKLEGFDSEWVEAAAGRVARYTNLPPGQYVFQVLAANGDGAWTPEPQNLQVTIPPRFYQTLWFRALVIVGVIGAIAGTFYLRVLQLARHNRELDQRVQERTFELRRAHEETQRREELFRSVFEHAPVGICWSRAELGAEFHFNSAFSRILRLPADTALTEANLTGMIDADDLMKKRALDEQIKTGTLDHYTLEQRLLPAQGGRLQVLIAVAVIRNGEGKVVQTIQIIEDVTALKEAEDRLTKTYQKLIEASRKAGMADVATEILHNVGNVLNSVNVSVSCLLQNARQSRQGALDKFARRFRDHVSTGQAFTASDATGPKLLEYLDMAASQLSQEQRVAISELEALQNNVDHINQVVARQQAHAKREALTEIMDPRDLLDEAIHTALTTLDKRQIELVRDYESVPRVKVNHQKAIKILVTLIQTTKSWCVETENVTGLPLRIAPRDDFVAIQISEPTVKIAQAELVSLFAPSAQSAEGYGGGLHAAANAAREMGGSLKVEKVTEERGATFTLLLPAESRS